MVSRLSKPSWYWLSLVGVIASGPGGIPRALGWLAMYALGRVVAVRRIARRLGRRRAQAMAPRSPSIFDTDIAALAESLRVNGFDARLRLPPPVVTELAAL